MSDCEIPRREMCNWNKFEIKFSLCGESRIVLGGKALSSLVCSLLNNASRKKRYEKFDQSIPHNAFSIDPF